MKRGWLLLFLLAVFLALPGCAGEAKAPAPDWPERLTGDYDDALTFTFLGAEPERTGVDNIPSGLAVLDDMELRFTDSCEATKAGVEAAVEAFLG